VTSRGVDRADVFRSDLDRHLFLRELEKVVRLFEWELLAYCLMTNHYHLVVRTPHGNLSKGMQRLNGRYAQEFNRRHGRRGHLWQGRFHSEKVRREAHLLELARYVPLNPVRAGICAQPEEWTWSSYRAEMGLEAPRVTPTAGILSYLDEADPERARRRYRRLVAARMRRPPPDLAA
jgi:putative transposase